MAGADASIYSLIRPVQPGPGPLQNYGQAMQLRALIDDQGLKQLQRQQLERGIADEDATAAAYREAGGDPRKVRDLLYGRGLYKSGIAVDKNILDRDKAESERKKLDAETLKNNILNLRNIAARVQDDGGLAVLRDTAFRMFGPKAVEGMPQSVSDPRFKEWIAVEIRDADQALERMSPKADIRDTGGSIQGFNPYTMQPIGGATPKTATPGDLLTDARGRQANAISAGNLGVSRERLAMDRENAAKGKWTNDLERGLQVNQETGETRPITQGGAPIGPKEKELNDAQAKALLFSNRMEEAEKAISSLAERGVNVSTPGARTGYGVGAAVNVFNPAERQQLDQAKRNFINAVLRRESGAVISDSEFANAEQQYFPQIGDAKDTIEQKARNRRTAIEGIKAEIPKAKRGEGKPAEGSPTVFDKLPDPAKYSGKRMEADDGTIYQSDGKRWVRK